MRPGRFNAQHRGARIPSISSCRSCGEGRLRLLLGVHRLCHQHDPEATRSVVESLGLCHGVGIGCMVEEQEPLQPREHFAKDFQAFGAQLEVEIRDPCEVATGPGKALNQSLLYRIAQRGADNRNPLGCLPRGLRRIIVIHEKNVHSVLHQLACSGGQAQSDRLG